MKGKPWTVEQEAELKRLLRADKSVRAIARAWGKTRDCVRMKIARFELEVVSGQNNSSVTTTSLSKLVLPR